MALFPFKFHILVGFSTLQTKNFFPETIQGMENVCNGHTQDVNRTIERENRKCNGDNYSEITLENN